MQAVLTISPNVSLGCLCAAWEKVVLAMPILRTTFGYHHGFGLVQVVLDKPVQWLDTTGQSLDMYLETDRNRPMEIGQMFSRHAIIEDDSGASKWFVWTVHHSLYDEWSMHLIMDALNKAAFCQDIMNGPQPQSFIKYVLQQADEENSTTYWENALAGYELVSFPELLPSIEHPIPTARIQHQFNLRRSGRLNITTSSLIRAAWALVAGRMTNSHDVVFGATVSGRNAPVPYIDKMAVPTIATVPVRILLSDTMTVSEYVEAVQRQSTEMMPYEQIGLSRLARMSPSSRQACQFQTLLVIQPSGDDFAHSEVGTWSDNNGEPAPVRTLLR